MNEKDDKLLAPIKKPGNLAALTQPKLDSFPPLARAIEISRAKTREAQARHEDAKTKYLQAMARRAEAEEEMAKIVARAEVWTPEEERKRAKREYALEDAEREEMLAKAKASRAKAEAERIEAQEKLDEQKLKQKEGRARRKREEENIGKPPPQSSRPKPESAAVRQTKEFDDILDYGTEGPASLKAEKRIAKKIKEWGKASEDELDGDALDKIAMLRNKALKQDESRGK